MHYARYVYLRYDSYASAVSLPLFRAIFFLSRVAMRTRCAFVYVFYMIFCHARFCLSRVRFHLLQDDVCAAALNRAAMFMRRHVLRV